MKVIQLGLSESCSEEALIMQVMREARRRTGMSRAEFARAIQRRSTSPLPIRDSSIRAYEEGIAVPVTNVWHHALALAGVDSRAFLERWLDETTSPAVEKLMNHVRTNLARLTRGLALAVPLIGSVLNQFVGHRLVRAVMVATAAVSPWW
ncbi:MAG TPA: hypothetical protein VKI99_05990 [Candidatus Dormibacteraeota bacterium]|nr:hypothetical protein [Candidatus Dormibacteraeota bacterium]